jgi:uncharacterized protein (TIGR03067 family)
MRLLIAVPILLTLSAGPITAGEKPADTLAKLQGSWTCVEWLKKGNKPPGRILLKIDKNRYEWSIRPNPGFGIGIHGDFSGTIKIDPAQKPAHLDLVGPRFTVSYIYRLRDDKLEILHGYDIKKRPASLEKPAKKTIYYLFERTRVVPDPANVRRHVGPVHLLNFSADGKLLLALSIGPTSAEPITASAKLFQVAEAKEWPHPKIDKKVLAACLSPDGKRLAAVTVDQVLHVWDVASGKELLSADYIWVNRDFDPKRRKAPGLSDQYMGLWPQGRQGLALAFSPDGKRLAVGHHQAVTICEEGKKEPVAFLKDYDRVSEDLKVLQGFLDGSGYQRILWTSDGKQVVAFGRGNLARGRVWNAAGGNPVALMPPTLTNFIRVTGNGKLLSTSVPGEEGGSAVQLIDLTTRKQLGVFRPAPVRNIAISRYQAVASADGKHLAIAGAGLVPGEVWDIKKKSLLAKLEKTEDRNISGFAQEITGDGKILIGASHNFANEDGRILFWDTATGKLLAEHKAHDGKIHTLALSPDGTLLASGSEDGTVRFWEVQKLVGGKPK